MLNNNNNNSIHITSDALPDIRMMLARQTNPTNGTIDVLQNNHHNKPQLFFKTTNQINCDENVNIMINRSPSSGEDNSPTEMNNCRRLGEKPTLVKRLTMGFIRPGEDSRPLVQGPSSSSVTSGSSQTISDGYVNEGVCDPEKLLLNKYSSDSRRKSLMSVKGEHYCTNDEEFDLKTKFLRETNSANSSPKFISPKTRPNQKRLDHLNNLEQTELKGAAWFQSGIPREISLEILARQTPGAFLVRQSSSKPGCFALSLRAPPPAPKVIHYLILKTSRGYKIQGFSKEFTTLRALITHHSVMPELLPVPLALPRPYKLNHSSQTDMDDIDNYGSSSGFRCNGLPDLTT